MKHLNSFLIVINGAPISLPDFEKTILEPTFDVSTTTEILKDMKYAAYVSCSNYVQQSQGIQQNQPQTPMVYKKNDSYIEFTSFAANDICVIYIIGYGKKPKRKIIKCY